MKIALPFLLGIVVLTGCQGWNVAKNDQASNPLAKWSTSNLGSSKERREAAAYDLELAKAENYESEKNQDAARAVYQKLIAQQPKRYEAHHRLGVLADRQRRHREAETLYAQAIRLHGVDAKLFNDLGYCLFLQGKFDKAEAALLKAVSLEPSNSRYRNNLGMVLGNQKRFDEALVQFRHAGSDADAYYNLAFILASNEDVEGAKNCFRLALASDSTHEPSRRALQSFERYERNPNRRDDESIESSGENWVAYEEEAGAIDTAVRQASYETPVARETPAAGKKSPVRPSVQSNRQALLDRARAIAADANGA